MRQKQKYEWHFDEDPDKAGYDLPFKANVVVELEIQGHIMRGTFGGTFDKRKERYGSHTRTVRSWIIEDRCGERGLTEDERVRWWYVSIPQDEENNDDIDSDIEQKGDENIMGLKKLEIGDIAGFNRVINDIELEGRYYDKQAEKMRDQYEHVQHTPAEKEQLRQKYMEFSEKGRAVYDIMLDVLSVDPESIGARGWLTEIPDDAKVVVMRKYDDADYENYIIMTSSMGRWYQTLRPDTYIFYPVA